MADGERHRHVSDDAAYLLRPLGNLGAVSFASELEAVVGRERMKDHPLELLLFAKDGGFHRGNARAIVFPETAAEVAACIKVARSHGVPIVPRGAGTGLAGGATPSAGALVVVLTKMNEIQMVDVEGRAAWVGPGVLNLDLSKHTRPQGVHYAPDPSSQAACTIGGNVATNAGGPHCLSDGTTVAHILAVELVTADGDIVMLGGEAPDPIGLDLRAVIVGSEGTLGVVTRILVKLTENPPAVRTLLMSFSDVAAAAETVSNVIAAGVIPAALEMMDRNQVIAVENFVHAGYPTDAAAVLLGEVAGLEAGVAAEAEIVAELAAAAGATEVRIARSEEERAAWWLGRKSAFGAVAQTAPDYYLHDTVVPRTRLVEVMRETYAIAERHDITMLMVIHAGDGNLHPLVAFDAREKGALEAVERAAKEMVRVSVAAGGTLSGEHGIGSEKRDLMSLVFDPIDLDAQARLREAIDPDQVFNPGKVLPTGSRCYDFDLAGAGTNV